MKEKRILTVPSRPSTHPAWSESCLRAAPVIKSQIPLGFLSPLSLAVPCSLSFLRQFDTYFCYLLLRVLTEGNGRQHFFPVILYFFVWKAVDYRDSSHLAPQILRCAVHKVQPCPFSWFLVSNRNRFWKQYSLEWFKILFYFIFLIEV